MSNEAITAVIRSSLAEQNDRLVLLILANIADHEGVCFPKVAYVCQATKLSERTVRESMARLEALKELAITRGIGRGNPSTYRLILPGINGAAGAPFSGPEKVRAGSRKGAAGAPEKVRPGTEIGGDSSKDTKLVNTKGTPSSVRLLSAKSELWETRTRLFDAYCDAVGIGLGSAEYARRWNFASDDLPDRFLSTLSPHRLAAVAAYTLATWQAAGITKTPALAKVLESMAEHDRWVMAGSPPIGHPRATDRAGRELLSSAEILELGRIDHATEPATASGDSGILRAFVATRGIPERTD